MSPTRALGYVRVSTAREDMISPELQESAIADHCTRHGYDLVDIHADLDQTGRNFARAEVQRIVERVEAGEAEVVVVWKVSRFGRTRRDWYVHADRLEIVGGRLESATEGFDAATSVGKFTRGMLVELAAFESDRIGDVWKEVHERRIRAGLPHHNVPRFGYVLDDEGRFVPDPETGPVLAECYARYVDGESPNKILMDLNRRGIRTTTGSLWTVDALRRVLRQGFGAGLIQYNGQTYPGAHEPVISPETWAAYEATRLRRSTTPPRALSSPWLMTGIAKCGHCGSSMESKRQGQRKVPMYRCTRHRTTGGAACKGRYVLATRLQDAVLEWLEQLAGDVDDAAKQAEAGMLTRHAERHVDANRLAREVTKLEGALVRLAQQHAEDSESDDGVYRLARGDYLRRLEAARADHAKAIADRARSDRAPVALARPLLDEWHTLSVEGRREILRQLVDCVLVVTRPGYNAVPWIRPVPVWELR